MRPARMVAAALVALVIASGLMSPAHAETNRDSWTDDHNDAPPRADVRRVATVATNDLMVARIKVTKPRRVDRLRVRGVTWEDGFEVRFRRTEQGLRARYRWCGLVECGSWKASRGATVRVRRAKGQIVVRIPKRAVGGIGFDWGGDFPMDARLTEVVLQSRGATDRARR